MKIGIVTKIGKNYGAVLQAYALKTKLCEMGHEAHIIKYIPKNSKKTYNVCKHPWRIKGTFLNLKSLLHFKEFKKSTERFYAFRDETFDFLGYYRNDEEIEADPPVCDIYISGSDQVWNPQISFDRTFYCTFADRYPNAKIATYAASIGLKKMPQQYTAEFKRRVQRFAPITVQERQALSILKEMDLDAELAPDPTLLLSGEEWHSASAPKEIEEPYILCYFVSFPAGIERIVDQIKKKYGIKVVNLLLSEQSTSIGDVIIRNAGPREFLTLFENASFVITSSFHGTVFSLINKKPFVVTLYESTSSRVTELLESFELTDRIVTPACTEVDRYCEASIYTDQHEERLEMMRRRGTEILKKISEEE